jgi:hypothetical protein
MEMKSEHATDCRLRQVLESGKKAKTPLIGVVCLLTKGVLIWVRPRPEFLTSSRLYSYEKVGHFSSLPEHRILLVPRASHPYWTPNDQREPALPSSG